MINIVILNKNSYEIILDKSFHKQNYNYKEYSQIFNTNIVNIIKNLDETSNEWIGEFLLRVLLYLNLDLSNAN